MSVVWRWSHTLWRNAGAEGGCLLDIKIHTYKYPFVNTLGSITRTGSDHSHYIILTPQCFYCFRAAIWNAKKFIKIDRWPVLRYKTLYYGVICTRRVHCQTLSTLIGPRMLELIGNTLYYWKLNFIASELSYFSSCFMKILSFKNTAARRGSC